MTMMVHVGVAIAPIFFLFSLVDVHSVNGWEAISQDQNF